MNTQNRSLLKSGKRLAIVLLVLFLFLCILATIGWYVLRSDHPYVIDKIHKTALDEWNAEIELEGYELEWSKLLSQLKIKIRGLRIANTDEKLPTLLKISHVTSEVNLWDLKTKDFHDHPIAVDSIWIHLYKDSLGKSNLAFREQANTSENVAQKTPQEFKSGIKAFPPIQINYLDFHNQSIGLGKWQKFQLSQVDLQSQVLENGEVTAHLLSDCFFDGLVFKEEEGGYLMNTPGKLNVNVDLLKEGKLIAINNTTLTVEQNIFTIEGQLLRTDSTELELKISTPGITLKEAIPLLSKKIKYVCRNIEVDQPVKATFSMTKNLSSKNKSVIHLDYFSKDTRLAINGGEMTSATFSGHFTNDCNNDGIVDPTLACLSIQQLEGDLLGMIPVKLHGEVTNLKNPRVNFFGELNINMPRLNPLLAAQDKFTFIDGNAMFDFHYQGGLKNLLDAPFEESGNKIKGKANFDNVQIAQSGDYASWPSLSGRMHFTEDLSSLDDIFLEWMGSNIHISGQLGNLPEYLLYHADALESDLNLTFDIIDFNQFNIERAKISNRPEENHMTPEKFEKMFRYFATNINGDIKIQVDSLVLNDDFFLTDYASSFQLLTPRNTEYIDSSMIKMDKMTANFMGHTYMSLDLGLSRDSITDLWLDLKIPNTSEASNFFLPENIKIMDGDARVELFADVPLRSIFRKEQLFSDIELKGSIDLEELEIGFEEVDWPVQKISGPIIFDNDQVSFENLIFKYENSPFVVNGHVNDYFYLKGNNPTKSKIDLNLRGNHFDLRNFTSRDVLPTPANIFRSLDTVFHLATVQFDLLIDSIITNEEVIVPFLLQAELIPDNQNPIQHQLVVDSINFGFGPENNVKGNILVTNPNHPKIDAHFKTRMKFDQFRKILPSEFLEFKNGYFKMDLDYHSSLLDSITAENYLLNAKVDGSIEIVQGEIFYNYRHFTFKDINAQLEFDQKSLSILDLGMLVNENKVICSGESEDLFPFFILPNRKAHIKLNVGSPYFDLGSFITPHEIENKKKAIPFVTVDTTESVLSNTGNMIDELLHKGSLEMSTDIKVLAFEKFKMNEIKGQISFQPDSVKLDNLNMEIAEGKVFLDGVLSGVVLHNPKVELDLKIEQNDMQEVLRQFENFGLQQFNYNNLKGTASADVQFKADVNSQYSILPETMLGNVQLQFNEGELIDVNALKNLSGFLFRNRSLDHIIFDTLATSIQIRGNNMHLERTTLRSSSFDFMVEGVYDLTSFDKTRVLLTIPFSNLYRRHITKEAMKSGNAKRKGLPILIEGKPKNDKLRFRWKLFNTKKNREKYRLIERKGN